MLMTEERKELNRKASRLCFMALFLAKAKMNQEYRGDFMSKHCRKVTVKIYHIFKNEIKKRGL